MEDIRFFWTLSGKTSFTFRWKSPQIICRTRFTRICWRSIGSLGKICSGPLTWNAGFSGESLLVCAIPAWELSRNPGNRPTTSIWSYTHAKSCESTRDIKIWRRSSRWILCYSTRGRTQWFLANACNRISKPPGALETADAGRYIEQVPVFESSHALKYPIALPRFELGLK